MKTPMKSKPGKQKERFSEDDKPIRTSKSKKMRFDDDDDEIEFDNFEDFIELENFDDDDDF